ncbi:MAG TPA: zinc-binding dehydrogenase, partial [Candidatus Methylomirabilis sp.]
MPKMQALLRVAPHTIRMGQISVPEPGPGEAVLRVSLTTVCGSDVHVLGWPLPGVEPIAMGHEAVGVIAALGEGIEGFAEGDRVAISCLSPCGHCVGCQTGGPGSACTHPRGGFQFGNLIHGCQAESVRVPFAQYNMAKIPTDVTDDQALFVGDIMSTGLGVCERAGVGPGDSVAVIAQGPLGLCATAGARLLGAGLIVAVDAIPERLAMARRLGASATLSPAEGDVPRRIRELTEGRGVDVAIEAVGTQATFEMAAKSCRVGGAVGSLGVYGGVKALSLPVTVNFYHRRIVTTMCPSGSERLRRMLEIVRHGRMDLTPLYTHRMRLGELEEAYTLFMQEKAKVLKIAV